MSFSAAAADERVLDVAFSDDALSVSLRDGRIITVPLVWYSRLLNATPAQRKNWKIAGGGYGLHWPDLDEDLSTEGLLRGAPAPRFHAPAKLAPVVDLMKSLKESLAEMKAESPTHPTHGTHPHHDRVNIKKKDKPKTSQK
ncbi:MAG: DUF2442 domain-containing protein [Candidatus Sulfotelmatobacter sp.]